MTEGSKRCPKCKLVKPLEAFCRNKRSADGRAFYCRPCHNEQGRETRLRLYGGSRHYKLRDRYGIGAAEVDLIIAGQGGLCAICHSKPATQVDHDHDNGRVRGILCDGCNGGLGAFGDDEALLERAAQYLESWN